MVTNYKIDMANHPPLVQSEMDFTGKTREQLIAICKEKNLKGYSGKKRDEIEALLQSATQTETKKNRGQFYTTNSSYILEGMPLPPADIRCIMEPFAGKGDLLEWVKQSGCTAPIEAYDIEPKGAGIVQRDTLKNPPNYENTWILTNPPYLARNKCENKELYDLYETNDLYKCFLSSVVKQGCKGGIVIIPAGFFFSPRDLDVRCRDDFLRRYKLIKVKYFEEAVFEDTSTTVVAIAFEKSDVELKEQQVEWELLPSKQKKSFWMSSANDWIIGGEIYKLSVPDGISVRRHVEGQALKKGEQQTFMTLDALDSGSKDGRICMKYTKDFIYPAKDCSRTYATLRISGKNLSEEDQIKLCKEFNEFVEAKREETNSFFLPQYRESKEYARKRIPFELAYRIVLHLIGKMPQA